jgi:hypothetical protein
VSDDENPDADSGSGNRVPIQIDLDAVGPSDQSVAGADEILIQFHVGCDGHAADDVRGCVVWGAEHEPHKKAQVHPAAVLSCTDTSASDRCPTVIAFHMRLPVRYRL